MSSNNHVLPLIHRHSNVSDNTLITDRRFTFTVRGESTVLEVKIKEKCDADYAMITWPAAPILSQFIVDNKSLFTGKRVLELGSGTGLCGIVAALIGAKVILTDSHSVRAKSDLLDLNVRSNGIIIALDDTIEDPDPKSLHICPLTWGRFTGVFFMIPTVDIIIASDCFYDPEDFEDILMTLAYFMTRNPETVFYTTYHVRNSSWNIECALKRWNLICECLHVDYEDDETECDASQGHRSRSTIIICAELDQVN